MGPLLPLAPHEAQVVRQMRQLAAVAQEWRLTLSYHSRKEGSYLQVEPTPYLKVRVQPDVFLAVE